MVKWIGSWYFRDGKTGRTRPSWRNRTSGEIKNMSKSIARQDLRKGGSAGYEPTGANFYGNIPGSKVQAKKDLIRVKRTR